MAAVLNPPTPAPARRGLYRGLLCAAMLLAFCVVGLGAYVRLADAGLGCPDWPGCYGHLVGVPDAAHEQAQALAAFPGRPVETGKAWKEMLHRYLAATLGLLIFALTVLAWRRRIHPLATTLLAAIVVFQALLGMWTVTLLLKPLVVTAHLLGGMTTLALLVWLSLPADAPALPAVLRPLALAALSVLIGQIALGGWVSSNYAALACADFPTCQGGWWPAMDFGDAFRLRRELGDLSFAALTAIHWMHRLGALAVLLMVGAYALTLMRRADTRAWGWRLILLLSLQLGLGIANVLLGLPLTLAVAHNLGAALLLAALLLSLWGEIPRRASASAD